MNQDEKIAELEMEYPTLVQLLKELEKLEDSGKLPPSLGSTLRALRQGLGLPIFEKATGSN